MQTGLPVSSSKNIRDEWSSGCDWLKLWQAYVKLARSDRNDVTELSDLQGMTFWASNVLTVHKSEIAGYKLSKAGAPVWATPSKIFTVLRALRVLS